MSDLWAKMYFFWSKYCPLKTGSGFQMIVISHSKQAKPR